jgi:hypothetical protein
LYDYLFRSYITGKLRKQSINFSSKSSLQFIVHKNRIAVNWQQILLPKVTRRLRGHAEVKNRMPQPLDAAASAHRHGGAFMRATLKNQPPLQNQNFDFCVPHHAYASVTAWLPKTKASNGSIVQRDSFTTCI